MWVHSRFIVKYHQAMSARKPKLTAKEVDLWHERITRAEEGMEENVLSEWKKSFEDFIGQKARSEVYYDDDDVPNFNFLLSTSNSLLPAIISADPYLRMLPRRPDDKDGAKIAEAAVNYVFREINIKKTIKDTALDAMLYGVGFAKIGYDPSGAFLLEEDYEVGPEMLEDEEEEPAATRADTRILREAMAREDLPFDEGPQDNPTAERVAPWDMLLPDGYDDINRCPWVCERITVRLEDLQSDDRFNLPKNISADSWLSEAVPSEYSYYKDDSVIGESKPAEYITVYEIRYWTRTKNGSRRRCLWLTRKQEGLDSKDTILRHIDDPLLMRGYPYQQLQFVRVPGMMYAPKTADLASIRPIADRLNQEWSYLLKHHRISSRRKWVALPGALEDGSLAGLLESENDMEVAEIPANIGDIRQAIMLLPEAAPPSTTPMVLQGLQRMMYEISGVDVYMRGGVGRKGTTATEVAVSSQLSSNRAGTRLDLVERFVEGIGRQMLSIIRQYWDDPRYLRISGPGGEDEFLSFSSGDITGMFDIRIEAGSTLGKDPATEQQAFMGLLQTIQATVGSLIPLVQGGLASPDTIKNFVDKAFAIWQADKRMLMEPLAAIQAAATPQTAASPEAVGQGRGMGGQGESLAGPPAGGAPSPGGATSGTGGTADLQTLMSRVKGA
ncbi:hypothetical protein CMI37_18365 [Candidatus Pacearchaeota archaeon]|nr:hypothetical protein [Candidatus Pacearchaeota archaeon]